ncbi:hypothetical protein H4219_005408, partial [Mycoemilia scoparia]
IAHLIVLPAIALLVSTASSVLAGVDPDTPRDGTRGPLTRDPRVLAALGASK